MNLNMKVWPLYHQCINQSFNCRLSNEAVDMRKRPIKKGSIMTLHFPAKVQSGLAMHASAQKVLLTLHWTYIELPVCQEDYFCTEGLQVTLFDVFGVPFLGS